MKIYLPSREIHDMTDTTVDVVSTSATTADASTRDTPTETCAEFSSAHRRFIRGRRDSTRETAARFAIP